MRRRASRPRRPPRSCARDAGARASCVVHGAGPQISAEMERRGLPVEFVGGRRVTTRGRARGRARRRSRDVNGELCAALGPRAVGLMGDEIGLERAAGPGARARRRRRSQPARRDRDGARRRARSRSSRRSRRPAERQRRRGARPRSRSASAPSGSSSSPTCRASCSTARSSTAIGADEADRPARRGRARGRDRAEAPRRGHAPRGSACARRDRRDGGARMSTATAQSALLPDLRAAGRHVRPRRGLLARATTTGRRYLDLVAGIAVVGLGHCHPAPLAAAQAQLERLWHVSNLYWTEPMAALAARLSDRFGGAQAFFCNSGAEAIEAALKYARKATGKPGIVALEGSFHGRTIGALSVTGQPAKRRRFEPLVAGRPLRAAERRRLARAAAVADETGLHPARAGPGRGRRPPARARVPRGRRAQLADEHGALLVFDEVQTGVGRTGTFFACEQLGVAPGRSSRSRRGSRTACRSAPARRRRDAARPRAGRPRLAPSAATPSRARPRAPSCDAIDDELLADVRADGASSPRARGAAGRHEVRGRGLLLGAELDRPAGAGRRRLPRARPARRHRRRATSAPHAAAHDRRRGGRPRALRVLEEVLA